MLNALEKCERIKQMFNLGDQITLKWTGHEGVRPDLTNTKATILKINRKRMIVKTNDNETLNILPEQTLEHFKANNYWIKKDQIEKVGKI